MPVTVYSSSGSSSGEDRTEQTAIRSDGLEGFDTLSDPGLWLKDDETELYYRRVTDNEVDSNGWFHSTYLVELEGGLEAVRSGHSDFTFIVPLSDDRVEVFDMRLVGSRDERSVEVSVGSPARSSVVTMRVYEGYQNGSERVAHLRGSNGGGLYGQALFNETDQDILGTVYGPESWWTVDDLLTVDGTTVNESAVVAVPLVELDGPYETICRYVLVTASSSIICGDDGDDGDDKNDDPTCGDGVDNDNDEWIDYPDDPGCDSTSDSSEYDAPVDRDILLMGEMKWCTGNANNWDEIQSDLRRDVQEGFRGDRDTRVKLGDPGWNLCQIARVDDEPSYNLAEECDEGETQSSDCTDEEGHDYIYYGARNESEIYRDNAWDYLTHFRQHNDSIPEVHVAQVIHDGLTDNETYCGLASFPDIWSGWDENISGPKPTGDNVAGSAPSSHQLGECPRDWWTHTHEVGHNFFAWHSDSAEPGWASPCDTVMSNNATCRVNAFSDANRRNVNRCIDDDRDACPREGTG